MRRIKYFTSVLPDLKKVIRQEITNGELSPFGVDYKGERFRAVLSQQGIEEWLVLLDYQEDWDEDDDDDSDDDDITGGDTDLDEDLSDSDNPEIEDIDED